MRRFATGCVLAWVLVSSGTGSRAEDTGRDENSHAFRTFFVTRSMAHEQLFPYLEAARPDIVQIGQYGPMFHGYADDEKSTKTPMQLPMSGERAVLGFQRDLNAKLHEKGHKVVGHFRLIKVMADWEEQDGFIDYYKNRWPEDLLGPKPHPDPAELFARDAKGVPIPLSRYGNSQLGFCLSSPHARQMLKQMLKVAVDHGVDGVITTYNYRYDCVCPYCQKDFKSWLGGHLSKDEIREKLGIEDLESHHFESIPAHIPGYPIDPKEPEKSEEPEEPKEPKAVTELDWLAMRWGAEHFKRMYDEIFIEYGRSLKKNLLVARWDHLSQVSLKEERNFVPIDLWGKGEDYFWYSGGASFVGKKLNLKEGLAGDAWLSSLYVRELSGRKPFVMGKYDGLRMAASMAEGYATGGLGMGRYMRFEDPYAFEVLVRYSNFRSDQDELFAGAVPFSDAALILPRQSVWNRRPDALDEFRTLGQALVERQMLIDVLVDERITAERLSEYPAVILPKTVSLSDDQIEALREFSEKGGALFLLGEETGAMDELGKARKAKPEFSKAIKIDSDANAIAERLREKGATTIASPWTIRAAAYSQPGRVILHLVNYDRDETPPKDRSEKGTMLERPIATENVAVDFRLPKGSRAKSVTLHAPDQEQPKVLWFDSSPPQAGRVTFTVPRLLVYGVIAIDLEQP